MSVRVLDSGSLAAGAVNEDAWGVAGDCAWVLDGATGLGRNVVSSDSDAAWFAHAMSAGLERRLRQPNALSPATAVAGALAETAQAYAAALGGAQIESYEFPGAAGILAAVSEQEVSLLWLGDCRAYWRAEAVLQIAGGGAIDALDDEALKALAAFYATNPEAGLSEGRAHVWPLLRRQRTTMNQEHGYWAWAPQEGLLGRAQHCTIPRGVGPLLLASDGFTRLWDTFAIVEPEEALAACSRGQGLALAQKLRAAELDDASGRRHIRFKQYDDCTWLCLDV